MFRTFLLLSMLIATLPAVHAKTWRNKDGSRSFEAEFVSLEGSKVTLKRSNGDLTSLELEMLHPDDRTWIAAHHAHPKAGTAFGSLNFGDNRKTVEEKLAKSTFVETDVDQVFIGRTGLNGIYRTKATIGGLRCYLFFDWTPNGSLREVTLQTEPVPGDRYPSLQKNWNLFVKDLSKIHGRPVQGTPYPARDRLENGAVIGTHLWRTDNGHSVLLGTAQELSRYNVIVRMTTEIIRPVRVGDTTSTIPSGPILPD